MNTKCTSTKKLILIAGLLLLASAASLQAQSGTWTNTASGGLWSATGNWLNGIVADGPGNTADFSTIDITGNNTVHLDASHTLSILKFGNTAVSPAASWLLDDNGSAGANILTLGATPTITVNPLGAGQQAAISAVVAGSSGLTKSGAGTLDLSGADTLTGGVTINAGTLTLDFTTGTTTVLGSQALTLGGGTLNILGANPGPSSQTFSGLTLSSGANTISAAPTSGGSNPTLTLGAFTFAASSVQFVGPATIGSGGGNVAATATITTTSAGAGALGLIQSGAGTAYATVGLYDWASTDTTGGTAGTTVIGGSQVTGFYTVLAGGGTVSSSTKNYDVTGATAASSGGSTYTGTTLRFNTATATTFSANSGKNWGCGGILVTPNVGANNVNFLTSGAGANGLNHNYAYPLSIFQNNTSGELIFNTSYYYNILGSGSYIQSGPGTVFLNGANGNDYTGSTYLNGGVTEIGPLTGSGAGGQAGQLGVGSTTVFLNGGTLIGDLTGAGYLDAGNGSGSVSTAHAIALGNNGGGLGAVTGTTLTVDGVVSNWTSAGPLVIGIPASSANGSTVGQLPGTGTGTANTTPVMATGTVVLNNTANTYTGGTVLDSGILQLTVNNLAVLGTGGITLNGGTFQWNGVTTDISSRTVMLSSGGTLDVNGNTVTLASPIVKGGGGPLTVASTAANGVLLLNGANAYTGTTTVNSGATIGGTGSLAGALTLSSGASALMTANSPLTVSGAVTLNGNTFTTTAAQTAGTYTLLTGGSISGTVNSAPGLGSVAGGNVGVVSISGNSVILTVTASGTAATWTDGNADQNWSEAGNWSGGVPHLAGDSATFNSAGGSAVTLDANESVAGITFNNPSSDVISGANTLTLDNSGNGAILTVNAGTANAINTSVALNDNATIVASSGESLTLGGTVSNSISGSKTLTITGGGTNILSSANTYGPSAGSVGTTLVGATVQVGNNSALGSGDVNVTGSSTLQSGAAGLSVANNIAVASAQTATVDNNGNNLTLGGIISGSGALTKIGNGTLTLSGVNTRGGATTISAGTLVVGGSGQLGGGAYAGNIINNGAFTYNSSAPQTLSGIISGSGVLNQNGSGTLTLSGANTFTNTTTINAGTLTLSNSLALQNSTVNYSGGSLTFSGITAATLGGLSGTANLSLLNDASAAVALTAGGNNSTTAYSGALSGSGSLTKNGTGTLTLSGNESLGGTLTANGGTLVLSGNNTYTGGTRVNPNATLQLQANAGNTSGGTSSAMGATSQLNMGGVNGSTSTLQLRSDSSVTFSGGDNMGGLGGTGGGETVALDVNQLTPAGANNTISFAPAGFPVFLTTFNITGGNGYTLALGPITAVGGAQTDVFNATTGNLTINGFTGSSGANVLNLNGTSTGNSVGGVIANGSGTLSVTKLGTGTWTLTAANTYSGTTSISNGTLVVGGTGQLGSGAYAANITNNGIFAYNSSAAQTLSGIISGAGALNQTGSGTLTLSGANTYTGNTAINAGIVNAGATETPGVSGPFGVPATPVGSISFGGGALQFSGANNADYSGRFVTSGSQPISIDTGGQTVSFATQLQGAGTTLTKIGNGTLDLAAAAGNTYTGNTTVNGGTLAVNNTTGSGTGSGNVTVANGGTLGGNGVISGAVEIQSGGGLVPGNGGLGTNTVGALKLDSGSVNDFEFNANPANDQTVVTGALTISDGSDNAAFNLYQVGSTSPWTSPGTYNLIQYGGSAPVLDSSWTTASGSNPHVANRQVNFVYSFHTSGGFLSVTIALSGTVVSGTWTNDADGNWSVAANWSSNPNVPHAAGDYATFGTGSSLRTVTLDANETVGIITMNNNNSFVIAGSTKTLTLDNSGIGASLNVLGGAANQIQTPVSLNDNVTAVVGSGKSLAVSGNIGNATGIPDTLTLNGTGTLTLSGNNNYGPSSPGSFGTILNSGVLQLGSNTALGAGDISFVGNGTLQAGTAGLSLANNLDIASGAVATVDNNGQNITLNGNITDYGSLTKTGNGTLTLNGYNTYVGNTIVNAGVLSISSYGNVAGTPTIILNGGDLLGNTGIDAEYPNIGLGPTNGSVGGTGLIDAASGQLFTLYGSIASAGNTGTNNLVVNSGAGDNGTVYMGTGNTFKGTTVISNGWLEVGSSSALQNSTLDYNNQGGALVLDTGIGTLTLGGLSGAQDLGLTNLSAGGVTLTVGNNNGSTTYSGSLNDFGLTGSLTKVGTGTLTLTGTNSSYNGATTISAGVLQLNTNGVLNTLSASVAAVGGAELIVSGGFLTATNASTIGNPSAGLRLTSGSATFLGGLSLASADNGVFINVTGGTLTATNLTLGRTALNDSAQPTAGSTGDGLYINGGAVNILANLNLGTSGGANSSVNTRIDSGSLTVGGALLIGLNNGARWSVVDVNGGSLMVTDVVTGISIGNAQVGNAELLIRNGTVNAGIIGLGYGTVADTVVLNQTNGSLYVGAGGIVQVSTNATASITLAGGLLGATTNWSCTNNIQLTGASYIIRTADTNGNPENIYLGGTLSGTGALIKMGKGTLVLSNADTCTGAITVSNGTLALVPGGSMTNTPQITIASNATFDVSALAGYTLTGANPVQTLAGFSTAGTANVNVTGNALTLASGAKALFQAAGGTNSPSIGKISVAGDLALTGNVITINVGGGILGAGTYRLLDCTGNLSGTASVTPVFTGLGATPGAAVSISTTTGAGGHVDLTVGKATPILQTATATSILLGQALSNSTLTVAFTNAAGTNVPGTAVFTSPGTVPLVAGTANYPVQFTPADTADYNTPAAFNVAVTVISPVLIPTQSAGITGFSITNGNVLISGTNGETGGTYYLLASTDLGLPLSQWLVVATNVVNTNGNSGAFTFIGTNAAGAGAGQKFYILSNTNN